MASLAWPDLSLTLTVEGLGRIGLVILPVSTLDILFVMLFSG